MKRGEQDNGHVESAVGVMRALVHILQIMQRSDATKYLTKPWRAERRKQSTSNDRWVGR
jgi:hypothetical protein